MVDTARRTRYEQIKDILDRAAGDSSADYDGHPKFWHLPLPRLLDRASRGCSLLVLPPRGGG